MGAVLASMARRWTGTAESVRSRPGRYAAWLGIDGLQKTSNGASVNPVSIFGFRQEPHSSPTCCVDSLSDPVLQVLHAARVLSPGWVRTQVGIWSN